MGTVRFAPDKRRRHLNTSKKLVMDKRYYIINLEPRAPQRLRTRGRLRVVSAGRELPLSPGRPECHAACKHTIHRGMSYNIILPGRTFVSFGSPTLLSASNTIFVIIIFYSFVHYCYHLLVFAPSTKQTKPWRATGHTVEIIVDHRRDSFVPCAQGRTSEGPRVWTVLLPQYSRKVKQV